jgi:Zn-dependent M28 family amino/carboxypeptidase
MKIDSQHFLYLDPYTTTQIEMVNVLVSFTSSSNLNEKKILLLAHYDSRPRAENALDSSRINQPIDGANDGASGVAVLMEIANILSKKAPSIDVDFVFVDGEDWGKVGDNENYLLGSKEYARQSIRDKYRFGIVIDMIGDSQQQIYREASSELFAKDINNMIFSTAKKLNIQTFIDSVKYAITDDHLSLNVAGIPSAVIIDFDYEYWHTEYDTPDKCSAQSLENVGKLLLEIIYNESLWPKK